MAQLFKNWQAICQVKDPYIMRALAWIDLESVYAEKLAKGFPECFIDHDVDGAIPLSVLREYADKEALREEGHPAHDMLESYGAIKHFNIPFVEFTTNPETL